MKNHIYIDSQGFQAVAVGTIAESTVGGVAGDVVAYTTIHFGDVTATRGLAVVVPGDRRREILMACAASLDSASLDVAAASVRRDPSTVSRLAAMQLRGYLSGLMNDPTDAPDERADRESALRSMDDFAADVAAQLEGVSQYDVIEWVKNERARMAGRT